MSQHVGQKLSQLVLSVAVPVPLRRSFDYLLDASALDNAQAKIDASTLRGCRVKVPFGSRKLVGIVLDAKTFDSETLKTDSLETKALEGNSDQSSDPSGEQQDPKKAPMALKHVEAIIDTSPVFDESMMTLASWIASFYLHPLGEVLASILPTALRKGASAEIADQAFLAREFEQLSEVEKRLKQSKKQLALCAEIAAHDKPLSEIKKRFSPAVIKGLCEKHLAKVVEKAYEPNTRWQRHLKPVEGLRANVEQNIAISAINQSRGFKTYLLEGVTGSGKTEVYLQVIEPIVKAGKQVLILVPEIGLTPQTLSRFEKRFGPIVGVVHSGLNDGQRLKVWQQSKAGELGIIIGTRSSIFMPLKAPGMIIVDEEHDESFKQQDNLKYHARDMAVYRARQLDIPLIMGSATPSLETLHNAFQKKYHHLQLTERAANASMPSQLMLDIKNQALEYGIAPGLIDKMRTQLSQGNQVLVFVHRRGYSPALLCHNCGHVEHCEACDNPYTLHKVSNNMQCHRCGSKRSIARACGQCGHSELGTFGLGTEQIEQGLQSLFEEYSCVRIDSDSTRGKGRLSQMLDDINAMKHQILIGTQILSKGHHFPNVTLAIILNVDGALFSADFRAPEKLGQLITQLSGRAGRANKPGEVWLQTHQPSHPLLQDLVQNGFADYARSLLLEREAAALPPYEHQVLLRAESMYINQAEQFLRFACELLSQFSKLKLIGPMPCGVEKKQGRFRLMLVVQCASRQYLHAAFEQALDSLDAHKLAAKIRWALDVAPHDFS